MIKFFFVTFFNLLLCLPIFAVDFIKLNVTFKENCNSIDTVYLQQYDGIAFYTLQKIAVQKSKSVSFEIHETQPIFYYITASGIKGNRPVIVGSEQEVNLLLNCEDIRASVIEGAGINNQYDNFRFNILQMNRDIGQLFEKKPLDNNVNSEEYIAFETQIKSQNIKKRKYIDSLIAVNPYIGKIALLESYEAFTQDDVAAYTNEMSYFILTYFKKVNFKDTVYNRIPYVCEAIKNYTNILMNSRIIPRGQQEYLDTLLSTIPEHTQAHKFALGTIANTYYNRNNTLYVEYANRFFNLYWRDNQETTLKLQKSLGKVRANIVGALALDFTATTAKGDSMSLSSLRGKYVLIDFWASWCAPCRRENPNVVKMYNEYHNKGFDIIGVSLDTKRENWLAAIEKDSLTWHHVSDLKGWSSPIADQYGVTSIPHTVLLSKDGFIMDVDLRGEALEARLKQIFDK
ncbi:MAG: TlpA family protein disulfide reductase [Saprospiraceae bacterium]|nr:TlpA family protein disulfide reductase [Saprospiraceae bacterium]